MSQGKRNLKRKPNRPSKPKLLMNETDAAMAFEMAMVRTRARWRAEGKKGTLHDLLQDANEEYKQHQKRFAAMLAEIGRGERSKAS